MNLIHEQAHKQMRGYAVFVVGVFVVVLQLFGIFFIYDLSVIQTCKR